ncbi:MAG: SDR family oxidoreductase [Anaerolineales bacterium]|jgi:3-oxoacyl-[acyl-carrier protein] reductase
MIDPGLKGKAALITGANNPFGIGAAIARALASHGVKVFLHYFRNHHQLQEQEDSAPEEQTPGLSFFFAQQSKTAEEVLASIRKSGGTAESWEADLHDAENAILLFERAERAFGQIDILVNNAAEYVADSFLPSKGLADKEQLWEAGPMVSTIDAASHDRHFAVNTRAAGILMREFGRRIIEGKRRWGRVINISADCAWGSPKEVSYRASKYALESFSRSAAAELGPHGITVNIVSPGPVQSGYISPEAEQALIGNIPLGRIGRSEDVANAVMFFASEQSSWITGQILFVHGGHRMAFGLD